MYLWIWIMGVRLAGYTGLWHRLRTSRGRVAIALSTSSPAGVGGPKYLVRNKEKICNNKIYRKNPSHARYAACHPHPFLKASSLYRHRFIILLSFKFISIVVSNYGGSRASILTHCNPVAQRQRYALCLAANSDVACDGACLCALDAQVGQSVFACNRDAV